MKTYLRANNSRNEERNCFYDIQFPQFISRRRSREIITNYIRNKRIV